MLPDVQDEERRLLIARVVNQFVLENGIEALAVREIAGRAGWSRSVVSHYSPNKPERPVFTHRNCGGSTLGELQSR